MFEMLTSLAEHGDVVVVWLLVGLSVIGLAIVVERLVVYGRQGAELPALKTELLAALPDERALDRLEGDLIRRPSTPARMCAIALACRNRSPEASQEVVESAGIEERQRLERGLVFLGTVGANAPFLGLFGTVLGIVKAFHDLSIAKTAGPQVVMAGISKALVATAVGLLVAIPAVVAYNYFKSRVKRILAASDVLVKLVLAHRIDRFLAGVTSGTSLAEDRPAAGATGTAMAMAMATATATATEIETETETETETEVPASLSAAAR